ncbi:hypothetical protein WN51_09551 [Melipona quadrifasciata]|uniref:Uncharacterized protein n=1 Tax=Melipona quadrifasciata TaxID=166423 RepID=A0A0N0BIU7_9HYME|nr:hypothetical protein WN51_09551 [Melipona quadrifasciata]
MELILTIQTDNERCYSRLQLLTITHDAFEKDEEGKETSRLTNNVWKLLGLRFKPIGSELVGMLLREISWHFGADDCDGV